MPTDGRTPSGGWKSVYAAMGASTEAEAPDEPVVRHDDLDGEDDEPPGYQIRGFAPAD